MQETSNQTYLMGYSGHSYVVLESVQRLGIKIHGYVDRSESTLNPYNLEYFGSEYDKKFKAWQENSQFILAVGDNNLRRKMGILVRGKQKECLTIIDPSAIISMSSSISSGTYISAGAIVNAQVKIGEDVIINTSVVVEHESVIGAGSHIAPSATILGNVEIGENVFVGANSVIKQGVIIGDNVVIGAGSVVIENVKTDLKVVGNPANRILK